MGEAMLITGARIAMSSSTTSNLNLWVNNGRVSFSPISGVTTLPHRRVDAHRLYTMVTSEPARMLKLPAGFGQVCNGGPADLLAMRDSGQTPANTLPENYPQLVVVDSRIRLVSSDFSRLCSTSILKSLQPLEVEGRDRYLISDDISSLLNETTRALEDAPRLAGKAIAA
jgi:hypothetical protein